LWYFYQRLYQLGEYARTFHDFFDTADHLSIQPDEKPAGAALLAIASTTSVRNCIDFLTVLTLILTRLELPLPRRCQISTGFLNAFDGRVFVEL
jgi:hypothetical protein